MHKLIQSTLGALLSLSMACSAANSTSQFAHKEWVISGYRCVFGCTNASEKIFKPYVGTLIKLDGSTLSDKYFGPCSAGNLFIDLQKKRTTERLNEYNENLPEGMQFTLENTGIKTTEVLTGEVACKNKEGGRKTILSVMSANNDEIIALEEDGLLLILKPIKF